MTGNAFDGSGCHLLYGVGGCVCAVAVEGLPSWLLCFLEYIFGILTKHCYPWVYMEGFSILFSGLFI